MRPLRAAKQVKGMAVLPRGRIQPHITARSVLGDQASADRNLIEPPNDSRGAPGAEVRCELVIPGLVVLREGVVLRGGLLF
jgi:hypothetical protein